MKNRKQRSKKQNKKINHQTPFFNKNSSNSFFKIQPKLKIGKSNDRFEKEADSIADNVINNKTISSNHIIQQKCDSCEEEIREKKSPDSPKPFNKNYANFEAKLNHSKGKGHKMESGIKSEMESKFHTNFDRVKIHTYQEAKNMNQEIGAQAFTHGDNIYFDEGKYNTNSKSGKHLLAHELTHTIQQNAASQTIQRVPRKLETRKTSGPPTPESCSGKEDISELFKKLKKEASAIIDSSELSEAEKNAKKQTTNFVLSNEGIFSVEKTTFLACDKIELPGLGMTGHGFNGYSNQAKNEIGILKHFKSSIEDFLKNKTMSSLLSVLKIIAHEKRHLTLSGIPEIGDSDVKSKDNKEGIKTKASYLVEEIIVNAEEIAINYKFQNGNYTVPLVVSSELHRHWNTIKGLVSTSMAEKLKVYILKELKARYSSKNRSNAISRGIMNAMLRGNWNYNEKSEN